MYYWTCLFGYKYQKGICKSGELEIFSVTRLTALAAVIFLFEFKV